MVANEGDFPKIPEQFIVNDNTGAMVATINADTSEVQISAGKVQGLANALDNVEDLSRAMLAVFKLAKMLGYTWDGKEWVKP